MLAFWWHFRHWLHWKFNQWWKFHQNDDISVSVNGSYMWFDDDKIKYTYYDMCTYKITYRLQKNFLAATKQLYKWYFPSVLPSVRPSVRLSICPSHLFSCDQAALQMVFSVCLSVCPSVHLSVCPSHLFDYVPIIVSSWNFQELLPMTNVRSMQKVKVRGQRSSSQRSQPNLTVSGL